jgi:hypothetical protein
MERFARFDSERIDDKAIAHGAGQTFTVRYKAGRRQGEAAGQGALSTVDEAFGEVVRLR